FGVIRRQHDGFPSRALACPGLEYKLGLEQMLFGIRNAEVLEHVPISSWVLSLVHVAFDKSAGWTVRSPAKRQKSRTLIVNNCPTSATYMLAASRASCTCSRWMFAASR